MNNIYFVIIAVIFLMYIISNIKKNSLSVGESFFWIVGSILMLILSLFPKTIDYFARNIGIEYPPSLLFVITIVFLLFIIFRHSRKITKLEEKIICLAQEVAILEGGKKK